MSPSKFNRLLELRTETYYGKRSLGKVSQNLKCNKTNDRLVSYLISIILYF